MESDSATVKLRNGSSVHFRPPTRGDGGALLEFLRSLSPDSRRLRFFSPACDLEAAARWAASADGNDHIGLIAVDSAGAIIGHAACVRMYGPRGEVAVEVHEGHRHLGLASLLLRRLACDAQREGIRTLVAEVLPDNHEMLAVFHDEFHAGAHHADGAVEVDFPSTAWDAAPARSPSPDPVRRAGRTHAIATAAPRQCSRS
jgi:GNAT superfamily N-acetyltransferase